jgi:hypothetical protein
VLPDVAFDPAGGDIHTTRSYCAGLETGVLTTLGLNPEASIMAPAMVSRRPMTSGILATFGALLMVVGGVVRLVDVVPWPVGELRFTTGFVVDGELFRLGFCRVVGTERPELGGDEENPFLIHSTNWGPDLLVTNATMPTTSDKWLIMSRTIPSSETMNAQRGLGDLGGGVCEGCSVTALEC